MKKQVAFALGGLSGSNAHGVGFLAAASEVGIQPDLISCTSGMIHWVANWLRGKDLEPLLADHVSKLPKLPEPFTHLSGLFLSSVGLPGVFRPAFYENLLQSVMRLPPASHKQFVDLLYPSRVAVPTRKPGFYAEIAQTFNQSSVGILFNSYNPERGREYLHLNEAARQRLGKSYGQEEGCRVIQPITPDYVEAALWLLLYGFDRTFHGERLIDGAYHRQFIIHELSCVDALFIIRPLSYSWEGATPTNLLEVEDFMTEMLFNSAFDGEVRALRTINHMLAEGKISGETLKQVDLVIIEIAMRRGYFDYFFESMEVFKNARQRSVQVLQEWRQKGAMPQELPCYSPNRRQESSR